LVVPPGEIDWIAVFNGTYDREHPEGRWFDPLKLWNRHYAAVVFREADPAVRADPALRRLCLMRRTCRLLCLLSGRGSLAYRFDI
jgi:hypothetical protein